MFPKILKKCGQVIDLEVFTFSWYFLWKISFSLQKEEDFWKTKTNKKQWKTRWPSYWFMVAKLLTLQHAYIYIYIYICCRVKTWSKNSLFLSQNLVQVFSFFSFFVFQKSSSFCRENEILKKNEQKKRPKKHHFWVKTWSNFVAQHTWTKFWLNLGPSFDSTFLLILGYFYLFEKMLKPLCL